jgi:hypothetical protein
VFGNYRNRNRTGIPGTNKTDFLLDQSAHLFTFLFSANQNAGNEKFTPRHRIKTYRSVTSITKPAENRKAVSPLILNRTG